MTEIFAAVTNRRLAFWEAATGLAVLDVAPWTRVIVTIEPTGQHVMAVKADGKSFVRAGNDYTPAAGPMHPDELGGIGPGTEYGDKVSELAFALAKLPYPWMESWADVEPPLMDLYMEDAADIIRTYPHLLSLSERERIAPIFPQVAA